MSILNGLIWSWLRRWYGGFFDDEKYKILGSRGLQSAIMILSIWGAIFDREIIFIGACVWVSFIIALWIQFQFWSRAIGEVLDSGRANFQNAESYDRWFRIPLDLVYDKLGKVKYRGSYDWWYMWLRYTLPMIIPTIAYLDFDFILIGLCSSPIYYGSWWLFDKFPSLYKLPSWIGQPKNLSEIIYGFCFGYLLW